MAEDQDEEASAYSELPEIRMHNQVLIMKCLNTRIQKQVLILDFLKISMHKQGITLNCQLQDPDIMETHLIHQSIL